MATIRGRVTLTIITGADTTKIAALSSKIQEEPEQGDSVWKTEITWQDGFRNQIGIRGFTASYADEPEALGGTNTAPNPVEQLLGALGSCLAIGYTANASVRGIKIEELRIELEGHIDLPVLLGLREGHAGYPDIDVRVYLKADAPQETVEELHQQVLRTSPVGQTIEKAIPLLTTLIHN
jgi:uncharacterized OsmC-like protein